MRSQARDEQTEGPRPAAEPTPAVLLTRAQAARMFSVGRETISRWVSQGKLPAVKINRKAVRFRPADLEAFAASRLTPDQPGQVRP